MDSIIFVQEFIWKISILPFKIILNKNVTQVEVKLVLYQKIPQHEPCYSILSRTVQPVSVIWQCTTNSIYVEIGRSRLLTQAVTCCMQRRRSFVCWMCASISVMAMTSSTTPWQLACYVSHGTNFNLASLTGANYRVEADTPIAVTESNSQS